MRIFSCIVAVLFGMIAGAVIGVLAIVKKARKDISARLPRTDRIEGEENRARVEEIVRARKKGFRRSVRGSVFVKTFGIGKKRKADIGYYAMVKEIAAVFNPSSRSPVFELNEKEIFSFAHDVTMRLTDIVRELNVPFVSTANLSSLISSADVAVSVAKNKWVGTTSKAVGYLLRVINALNPFYWVKKIFTAETTFLLYREVVEASIEIVGKQFAALYGGQEREENEGEAV